jgi:hypothetical protein
VIWIPKVRIARAIANCHAGGERAVPCYIEVRWFDWRWMRWLGPRVFRDQAKWG